VTTLAYDKVDRQIAVTNPEGETATTVYDDAGRAIGQINPLNLRVTTTYDKADRPISVLNAELERSTTVYDAAGRTINTVNPLGFVNHSAL
jgi:YD repeat-containing protein